MASSCVLRASGDEFEVAEFLRESSFKPINVFLKGERKSTSKMWNTSGMTVNVSEADFFEVQVSDAVAFIESNSGELHRLKESDGVVGLELDFGVYARDAYAFSYVFPLKLISLANNMSLELELSIYPAQ